MTATSRRWPAEWEQHDATWIAWPHHEPDWPGKFEAIPWVYAEIVRALHLHERVEILCHDEQVAAGARDVLLAHNVDLTRCGLHVVPTDRVWVRDSGPTGVYGPRGMEWIHWGFNAWAKYPNHLDDERAGGRIAELTGRSPVEAARPDGDGRLVLEGGGIEGNGNGLMLVTEEWLLSDIQVRNPGMSREQYEQAFAEYLGTTHTIWLGEGTVGDDTHGHIDDVARFVDHRTIVIAHEADPADENHPRSVDNLRRLARASEMIEGGLRIVTLPYPRPVIMDGERLPASYANFYIANGVVLVPTFNDPMDRVAMNILAELFPGRDVVGIHSVDLVWGLGTLHCLTQQQPAGL
ncbi:MAG: agmatine deiminase family protein [Gemmatimonadota bacterium]|jgi:agmatine deiminase|nr:agmatine deiminase family protein [Gemmatimonadota bacterium]